MDDDHGARATEDGFEWRLNRLDKAIERLQPHTSQWQKNFDLVAKNLIVLSALVGALGTVIIGLWGGEKLYIQTQDLIDRTDRQISEIVGASRPNTASAFGLNGRDDRKIRYRVHLEPRRLGEQVFYRLILNARLRVSIVGNPGTITRYYSFLEGNLPNAIAIGFDGRPDEVIRLAWGSPHGKNYSESGAEIISSKSSVALIISWSISLRDCSRAHEILSLLTEAEQESKGVTWVVPVFRYIEDAPEFKAFDNYITKGAVFDCYDKNGERVVSSEFENPNPLGSSSEIEGMDEPSSD